MQSLPHHYHVAASAESEGVVTLVAEGLPALATAPPVEFGGPGDLWSPETLLIASVADCFVLTFRAIARASSLTWGTLDCAAAGDLDRVEGQTRFTAIRLDARLMLPEGGDVEKAKKLLEKAERGCLVSNSLACPVTLHAQVEGAEAR